MAAITITTSDCNPPRPRPCSDRQMISWSTDWEKPASTEPTVNTVMAICTSSFLLTRSESLPQIGVLAVEASRVAVTTQVYWFCVPCSSGMIVGSALATIVDDRNAVNIASSSPESASRVWRWVIWPPASAGGRSVGREARRDAWAGVTTGGLLGASGG